ncbi:MAG: hypothetical protein ACLTON_05815 [Christensenellales bacterium]
MIGGVSGGINSAIQGGSFFDGFESGAFDGAVGGAIGGAITGGLTPVAGPALSMVGSIGRVAGIGALSNGVSNMCVTTIDYLVEHGNLNGALDDIAISGFSGALSGGIMGGFQFKMIYTKLSEVEVSQILSDRGLDKLAIRDIIDSFDGPIYAR